MEVGKLSQEQNKSQAQLADPTAQQQHQLLRTPALGQQNPIDVVPLPGCALGTYS